MDVVGSDEPAPGSGWELLRDPKALRVLANPTRMRIYTAAVYEPVSAKELADRFEQPLSRLSYHMRRLADNGLLRAVRQTPRRGAIQTHYRAVATFEVHEDVLDAAGAELRALFAQATVRDVAEDLLDAAGSGAADLEDYLLTRAHFRLTPEGRKRLFDEVVAFFNRLAELEPELRREAEAHPEATEEVNVVLAFYEGQARAGRNRPLLNASPHPDLLREDGRPAAIPPVTERPY
ncbi:MAG TPA: helix-turn-helix domain-containing protein [Solirubrobacteraceae bacterium]|jgi:DNA-binding transcriptional ArsR family regulator